VRWGSRRGLGVGFGWCVVPDARFVPVVVGPDKRLHCWFALGEGAGQAFDDRAGVQLVDVAEAAGPHDPRGVTHLAVGSRRERRRSDHPRTVGRLLSDTMIPTVVLAQTESLAELGSRDRSGS
jgi:hypothetical protein